MPDRLELVEVLPSPTVTVAAKAPPVVVCGVTVMVQLALPLRFWPLHVSLLIAKLVGLLFTVLSVPVANSPSLVKVKVTGVPVSGLPPLSVTSIPLTVAVLVDKDAGNRPDASPDKVAVTNFAFAVTLSDP